jgi:hypothetical protein
MSVANYPDDLLGTVRIGMEHLAPDGGQHEFLIRRKIKLDLWPTA